MRDLNNKGVVSFTVMVIFLIIFIVFLLVVAILANGMGIDEEDRRDANDNFVPDASEVLFE